MSQTTFSCLCLTLIGLVGSEKASEWSWAVSLSGGTASEIANEFDMENMGEIFPGSGIYEFSYARKSVTREVDVRGLHAGLLDHRHVNRAELQEPLVRVRRKIEFNDPSFPSQWHLVNHREKGHDLNVTWVWEIGIAGGRVSVAVVDDGLEHRNPELQENYNPDGSYDFNDNDRDPTPDLSISPLYNSHGTRCAGLVAAVANNGVCGVGVAYKAMVSGIRMLDGTITDILEARSLTYKTHVNSIYSCSWGPSDDGMTVEGPGSMAQSAFQLGTSQGRFGYGSIFVFAAGNGGKDGDNCNYDGYANSIFTLTIGAVDEQDLQPYYSEDCAAKFAVTYSNGKENADRTIVTADVNSATHYCTNGFSGTSAAAPMAAGVIALVLQVRPCLTWRDIQSLVVFTALPVDAVSAQWVENGAGLRHSHQHGYGVLHAYNIVMAAKVWPLIPAQVKWSSASVSVNGAIPFATSDILGEDMTVDEAELPLELSTLEHVVVTVTVQHSYRGALLISLTSPSGTDSQLATARPHDKSTNGLTGWEFTTIFCWGEEPAGVWSLRVKDKVNLGSPPLSGNSRGKLISWQLTLYGSNVSAEEVQGRKSLAESVRSGDSHLQTVPPCPPNPTDVTDIYFTEDSTEVLVIQVIAGVLVVVATLLIVNTIVQYLRQHNACRRKDYISALPPVHFRHSSVMDEEAVLLLNDTDEPHSSQQTEEQSPPLSVGSTGNDQLQADASPVLQEQPSSSSNS